MRNSVCLFLLLLCLSIPASAEGPFVASPRQIRVRPGDAFVFGVQWSIADSGHYFEFWLDSPFALITQNPSGWDTGQLTYWDHTRWFTVVPTGHFEFFETSAFSALAPRVAGVYVIEANLVSDDGLEWRQNITVTVEESQPSGCCPSVDHSGGRLARGGEGKSVPVAPPRGMPGSQWEYMRDRFSNLLPQFPTQWGEVESLAFTVPYPNINDCRLDFRDERYNVSFSDPNYAFLNSIRLLIRGFCRIIVFAALFYRLVCDIRAY